MKRIVPILAISIATALALSACSTAAPETVAMSNAPAAGSGQGAATASAAAGAEPEVGRPKRSRHLQIHGNRPRDRKAGRRHDADRQGRRDVVLGVVVPRLQRGGGRVRERDAELPSGVMVLGVAGESSAAESKTFIADHPGIENSLTSMTRTATSGRTSASSGSPPWSSSSTTACP